MAVAEARRRNIRSPLIDNCRKLFVSNALSPKPSSDARRAQMQRKHNTQYNYKEDAALSENESTNDELGTAYEMFIGALSVLSLVNLVLVTFLRDQATENVIFILDVLLSVVFLLDFLVRLSRAPSRSKYVFRQFGWADLLGSLPFPQAKILRIFRVIRVIRLLRRYGLGTV